MNLSFPNFIRTVESIQGKVMEPKNSRVLFHHLPKTAGSTFRAILDGLFTPDEICPAETHWELDKILKDDQQSYRLFAGHFTYDVIDRHLKNDIWLTFLRSPVERVVSQYHNHVNEARQPESWINRVQNTKIEDIPVSEEWREYHKLMKNYTLIDWVTSENRHANATACNLQTQSFISRYQTDETGCRIDKRDWSIYDADLVKEAKENLEKNFEFIGLQEYFDLSLDIFAMTFGRYSFSDSSAFTTNLNTDKSFGSKYALPEEDRQIIEDRNSMDLELYNFAKDLFFKRLREFNRYYLNSDRINRIATANQLDFAKSNELIFTKNINISIENVPYQQGFYSLEKSSGRYFRWSGSESPCLIELSEKLEPSKLHIFKVHVIATLDKSILDSIKIKINGSDVNKLQIKKCLTGGNDIIFSVITEVNSYITSVQKLEFIHSTITEPTDLPGARELGLAVSSISVYQK